MEPGVKGANFPKKSGYCGKSFFLFGQRLRSIELFNSYLNVQVEFINREREENKTIWIGWRLERIKELKGSLVDNPVSPIALDKPIDSTSFSLSNIISQVSLLDFWCQKHYVTSFRFLSEQIFWMSPSI